jgi:hypothetical protein
MIVAVSDEEIPVLRNEDSVGAIQSAIFGLSFGTVSFESIADNCFHDPAA